MSTNIPEIKISFKGGKSEAHKITCSEDAFEVGKHLFNKDTIEYCEEVLVIYLNSQKRTIGYYKLGLGGLSSVTLDPRIVMAIALKSGSTSMIIFHNHPSGALKPSASDVENTRKIFKAGELLDIQLLDHIIIGSEDNYLSLAEEGLMND